MKKHILIGLGGTGGRILQDFKLKMFEEFPDKKQRAKIPVSFLYVDSSEELITGNTGIRANRFIDRDASICRMEFLKLDTRVLPHVLDKIDNYPVVKLFGWNQEQLKNAIGECVVSTGGKRIVGRILLATHAHEFIDKLKEQVNRTEIISDSGDPYRLNFHIFTSLTGGTGAGTVIDAIVQTRKNFPESVIQVYAILPDYRTPSVHPYYFSNAYATLKELNALQTGRWHPIDIISGTPADVFNKNILSVADSLTLVHPQNTNGLTVNPFSVLPKIISDYIFARIFHFDDESYVGYDLEISSLFKKTLKERTIELDEKVNMQKVDNWSEAFARTKKICSFGIKRIVFPEKKILRHVSDTVALALIDRLLYKNWESEGIGKEETLSDETRAKVKELATYEWQISINHLSLDYRSFYLNDLIWDSVKDIENDWYFQAKDFIEDRIGDNMKHLDMHLHHYFDWGFRDEGVNVYFQKMELQIPKIVQLIYDHIKQYLINQFIQQHRSVSYLIKICEALMEYIEKLPEEIQREIEKYEKNLNEFRNKRSENLNFWDTHSGIMGKIFYRNRYVNDAIELGYYYEVQTILTSLEFAKNLVVKLIPHIQNISYDIKSLFNSLKEVSEGIKDRLYTSKLTEIREIDTRDELIELYDIKKIEAIETLILTDKFKMVNFFRTLKESLNNGNDLSYFEDFDYIAKMLLDFINSKLPELISGSIADTDVDIRGFLNELCKAYPDEGGIKNFAMKILENTGTYIKLDKDELSLHVPNNEGYLATESPGNSDLYKKCIIIPANYEYRRERVHRHNNIAQFIEEAIYNNNDLKYKWEIDKSNFLNKNEFEIIILNYLFPMRAIDGLKILKEEYDKMLNSGDETRDERAYIILHSEKYLKPLPSLFVSDITTDNEDDEPENPDNSVNIDFILPPLPDLPGNPGVTPPFPDLPGILGKTPPPLPL